jgi:nicotinate-nucleotide adenylyltransferase
MKPVGVLGGTFDPVHHGHLRLALEVYEALELQAVRLIPLNQPPHRSAPVASPELRLRMLHAAIGNERALIVDDRELRRQGPSYTVDTLTDLRGELGDIPLCLLMGLDAFAALDTWHEWTRLIELAHIVVAQRPDAALPTAGPVKELFERHRTDVVSDLHQNSAGCLWLQPIPQLDISASGVRALIATGRNLRYLLPDGVIEIIHQHHLYRDFAHHAA